MLCLVGAGLKGYLTIDALEALKECDEIYVETYTLPEKRIMANLMNALSSIGKEAREISREKVESSFLIDKAKDKNVALICGGDVFAATTHYALYDEAVKKGIKVSVFHNSSIFTAVGKIGLSLYKFGYTVTIAQWREGFKPTSPARLIKKNMENGYHTLVLVDTAEGMDFGRALFILNEMANAEGLSLTNIFALSRLGFEDERIIYASLEELKALNLPKPFSFVVPGSMSRIERDFALRYALTSRKKV